MRLVFCRELQYLPSVLLLICGLALLAGPAAAASKAAKVTSLKGVALYKRGDAPFRNLAVGDVVLQGDGIRTQRRSALTLEFTDRTRFDLGPESEMVIGEYSYAPATQEGSITTRVLKGAFRFISGFIARKKPKAMSVKLSVATIGIRGTHVGGEVTPTSAKVVLLEPEVQKPTAIEVFNQYGAVTVDKPGYGTEIPDEHSPPSPVRRMRLRSIQNLMRTLQSIQRVNIPRPRVHP
ncbi:MAG: hypothetical protein D6786_01950 [Gammaproteobacteria bacterium]|nr:MAG: hypothetical protein D6786_01950 [Gammaproteobacteria bacterium]